MIGKHYLTLFNLNLNKNNFYFKKIKKIDKKELIQ